MLRRHMVKVSDACVCGALALESRSRLARHSAVSRAEPLRPEYTPERGQNNYTTALELLFRPPTSHCYTLSTMALASKTQSQTIFAKLKAKPANKVSYPDREGRSLGVNVKCVDMF